MGYIQDTSVVITEPKKVSLSALPNFVQFESKPSEKALLEVHIKVTIGFFTPDLEKTSLLKLITPLGGVKEFYGTREASKVGGNVFFAGGTPFSNAENLRKALLSDAWIKANFDVDIILKWKLGIFTGDTLLIKSEKAGKIIISI